ncbi:hypothetical protein PUN28_002430 [Cardiocondyla obscurior]|uniref:Uncharacterized protein n=1 Tax=Cardiocondyla obscurior TaxID=286306 RepID=A0AAW2GU45_9HYME
MRRVDAIPPRCLNRSPRRDRAFFFFFSSSFPLASRPSLPFATRIRPEPPILIRSRRMHNASPRLRRAREIPYRAFGIDGCAPLLIRRASERYVESARYKKFFFCPRRKRVKRPHALRGFSYQ